MRTHNTQHADTHNRALMKNKDIKKFTAIDEATYKELIADIMVDNVDLAGEEDNDIDAPRGKDKIDAKSEAGKCGACAPRWDKRSCVCNNACTSITPPCQHSA